MAKNLYIRLDFFKGQSTEDGNIHARVRIVEALVDNKKKYTLRGLGALVGMKSPQTVKHYLLMLMQEGMIFKDGDIYKLTPAAKKAIKTL